MQGKVPILFLSDSISTGSGLARIHRDLVTRTHEHMSDVFRVATAGWGGAGYSRKYSFPQYNLVTDNWVCLNLPEIWHDFAGNEPGIIFTIWDAARLSWFSRPELSAELENHPDLRKFLTNPPFQKWIYAPVDAGGPNNRLTYPLGQSLLGFDRILAYGKFGEDVIRNTLGEQESEKRHLTSLPHGIDCETFYPRNRQTSRAFFFSITGAANIFGKKELIKSDELLLGAVATNQSRKDMALLIETAAILSRQRPIRLWLHTDILERTGCWSIPALLMDFGLIDRAVISLGYLPDDAMAKAYSACDVTVAPGAEGFGFPIAESLACGTPVCHGSYGGGADLLPVEMTVDPIAFRYESIWACKRPVYRAADWADRISSFVGTETTLQSKYDWVENWKKWEDWLREAAK